MSHGPLQVQAAVYTKLTGDATLMALINGVYDFVTQKQSFPWVGIGDDDWVDRGSHTTDGYTGQITIHTWTQNRGRKDAHEIMAEIDRVLHDTTLTITGWDALVLRRSSSRILVEPDTVTFHGVQTFDILITET